ncbi:hypothetical protein MNB_SV-3-432 [hydrothermal vent metagenome]|uniref:Serine kinase of the HPr protein, regulates carbohydrate metabolism n=1 Tax=hydrothermal vent metagenome TaxID=652676 RepID=A0A1W1CXW2_9ZZZZ
MIHGHQFIFRDEPLLREEYEAFSLLYPPQTHDSTIEVIKATDVGVIKKFAYQSDWRLLSAQNVRYWSHLPFEKVGKGESWGLEVKGVLFLLWEASTRKIIYIKDKGFTPYRLRFWIYHTFFSIVLDLEEKYTMMHVGAVEIARKPVFFSAPSFGGKSTLTDYFLKQGHTLFSDDSLPVHRENDRYFAIPSFPYHRPYRKPEELGYFVENFAKTKKPIHAVYLLERVEADEDIYITVLQGIEKYEALHFSNFIDFSFTKKRRFLFFSQMAKYLPVYKITLPWDLKRLNEVYCMIVEHSQSFVDKS